MKKVFYSFFIALVACWIPCRAEEYEAGGRHVIADLFDCASCDYSSDIERVLQDAAHKAGATILNVYVHKFSPQGMTGMVVLSESHIAFHTWPEHGYVACDIFTCGSTALPEKAIEVLVEFFKSKEVKMMEISRGKAGAPVLAPYPIAVGQVWQHYKGNKYEVVAIGHHSETEEQVVVYKGLYNDPVFGENPVWVRPIGMFFERVEYNGTQVQRFICIK